MLSLYNIEKEYLLLAQELVETGGELTPELEAKLSINREQLEHKGQSYGFVVKQLEAEVGMIDQEIKRLQGLKTQRLNAIDKLKYTLEKAMELYGIDKIEGATLKLSFRKSEAIEITEERLLSPLYLRTKTETSPDKTAIKEAIKRGEEVQGARLVNHKSLQIK